MYTLVGIYLELNVIPLLVLNYEIDEQILEPPKFFKHEQLSVMFHELVHIYHYCTYHYNKVQEIVCESMETLNS